MSYVIYGLRLRGSSDVRYIGQTMRALEVRLRWHGFQTAHCPVMRPFGVWLRDNGERVECFAIAKADNLLEAKQIERTEISAAIRAGAKLFNRHHVPAALRILEAAA